jgi:hypothetical protein
MYNISRTVKRLVCKKSRSPAKHITNRLYGSQQPQPILLLLITSPEWCWLVWSVVGYSPRRRGFHAVSGHMGFVVNNVVIGQFSQSTWVSPTNYLFTKWSIYFICHPEVDALIIATAEGLDGRGSIPNRRKIFLTSIASRLIVGPTEPHGVTVPGLRTRWRWRRLAMTPLMPVFHSFLTRRAPRGLQTTGVTWG